MTHQDQGGRRKAEGGRNATQAPAQAGAEPEPAPANACEQLFRLPPSAFSLCTTTLILASTAIGLWLWWWFSDLNPGVAIARGVNLALCVGALWAALHLRRLPVPALWCLAALAWQTLTLLWAPVRDPGVVWLGERSAALILAAGTLPLAIPLIGAVLLALACLPVAWAMALRLGAEAPGGLANFNIGGLLPLVAAGGWRWLPALVIPVIILGLGLTTDDSCRAAWLGGATAIATLLALRLPGRWPLIAIGLGAAAFLAVQLAAIAGAWNVAPLGASATYRVHLWRAAMEACWNWHGLIGHGVGSSVAVLIEQPAYAEAFRAVPSYAEHAHHEVLQALLDGGLVNLGLLTAALATTLWPLWRQRNAPLLAAWAVVIVLALVESHLSQPIALLGLALLAGASWRYAPAVAIPARWPFLAVAGLTLLLSLRDAGDGGNPPMLEARARMRLDQLRDPASRLAELDRLRARVGPLDWIDLERARELKRLGVPPLGAHRSPVRVHAPGTGAPPGNAANTPPSHPPAAPAAAGNDPAPAR